jgi:hypothetical protein
VLDNPLVELHYENSTSHAHLLITLNGFHPRAATTSSPETLEKSSKNLSTAAKLVRRVGADGLVGDRLDLLQIVGSRQ